MKSLCLLLFALSLLLSASAAKPTILYIIANGRSTAGAPQKNDVTVIVAKPNGKAAKE